MSQVAIRGAELYVMMLPCVSSRRYLFGKAPIRFAVLSWRGQKVMSLVVF